MDDEEDIKYHWKKKLQHENSTKTFFPSQDDSFYMYKCIRTFW